MASIFQILKEITSKHNVDCLLIGGYAVNSHKVSRHTADIDFMITRENYNCIKEELFKIGYSVLNEQNVFAQLTNVMGYRDLDFMFAESGTIKMLLENACVTTIGGQQFFVPSVSHLIALKLHSIRYNSHREFIDFPDIINLIDANGVNIDSPDFVALCKKFGTDELYEKIRAHFQDKRPENE